MSASHAFNASIGFGRNEMMRTRVELRVLFVDEPLSCNTRRWRLMTGGETPTAAAKADPPGGGARRGVARRCAAAPDRRARPRFRDVIGPEPALALEAAVELAARPKTGGIATAISVVTLLLGASGVFGQLRSSLDRIWDVDPARAPWRVVLRTQILSYGMVLLSGLLLLISLVLNTVLAAFGQWASQYSGDTLTFIGRLNALIGYVIVTAMFATMFKTLPDVRIGWRDVWIGALITSFLFAIGRSLIGFYIVGAGVGSSYGFAGSVLIILAWVYYSALIFFFGAECTAVFAHEYGTALGRRAPPKPLLAEANPVPKGVPTGESSSPQQGPPA